MAIAEDRQKSYARTEERRLWEYVRSARPRRLRPMEEWAESELILPDGPAEGLRFRYSRQPFMRLLHSEFDSGRWKRRAVTGCQQSGKTLAAFVIPTLWHLFEYQETVICGLPTMDIASDKWELDLLPAIEASRYRDLLPTSGPGSRGGTPELIKFKNGSALKFMSGGGSDKKRSAFTSRVLIVTEVDGLMEDGQKEASKLKQMQGRVRAYGEDAREYLECTVSTTSGPIWQEYTSGTASRIVADCPHCGEFVSPERENLVGWEEAADVIAAAENAAFACPSCGELFTNEARVLMNQRARLLHRGQTMDKKGRVHGNVPRTETLGFRWSAFWNMLTTPGTIAAEEWESLHSDDRDNSEKALKQWVWTEPIEEEKVEETPITTSIVAGSAHGYAGRCNGLPEYTAPKDTRCVTAFIDLGKRFLPWQITADRDGSLGPHTLAYGWWETPKPDVVGEIVAIREGLRELKEYIDGLPLKRDGGGPIELHLGLIDCGNWNTIAYDIALEWGGIWRVAMGDPHYSHPRKNMKDKRPSPNGDRWYESRQKHGSRTIWVINHDPDVWKTRSHASFMARPLDDQGNPAEGSATIFGETPKDHLQFAEEVTAEVWTREWKDGRGYVEGFKKVRRHNHQLDCHSGNLIAASVCGGKLMQTANKSRKRWSDLAKQKGKHGARA